MMKRSDKKQPNKEAGVALMGALFVTVMLVFVTGTMMHISQNRDTSTESKVLKYRAGQYAEAGFIAAQQWLNDSNNDIMVDGTVQLSRTFEDGGSYTVTIQNIDEAGGQIGGGSDDGGEGEEEEEEIEFDIVDGNIIPQIDVECYIDVLGTAISYGGSYDMPVTVQVQAGDATIHPWDDYDNAVVGNVNINNGVDTEEFFLGVWESGTNISIDGKSWKKKRSSYSGDDPDHWKVFLEKKSNDGTPNVLTLRNGDAPPEFDPAHGQPDITDFLEGIMDDNGLVHLQDNEVVLLFELGTTNMNSSAADFQDLICLVTLELDDGEAGGGGGGDGDDDGIVDAYSTVLVTSEGYAWNHGDEENFANRNLMATFANNLEEIEDNGQASGVLFQYAIFSDAEFDINGSFMTDSYDSSEGEYSVDTANSNGRIGTNSNLTVNGSSANIWGDADYGAEDSDSFSGDASTVHGEINRLEEEFTFSTVNSYPSQPVNNNESIPEEFMDDDGFLTLRGNDTLELTEGTYHLTGIDLRANSYLHISGQVIIYLDGPFDMAGTANLYNSHPRDLIIFGLGDTGMDPDIDMTFHGDPTFTGAIYAPGMDILVEGNINLFGSLMGKLVTVGGSSEVHYDEDLLNFDISGQSGDDSILHPYTPQTFWEPKDFAGIDIDVE